MSDRKPWKPYEDKAAPYSGILDADGRQVCHSNGAMSDETAALVCKAVNCHDDLLTALSACLSVVTLQNGNLHDDINVIQEAARAAIAKATPHTFSNGGE